MWIDSYFSEILAGITIVGILGLITYLKKKFNCQDAIKTQLDTLNSKFDDLDSKMDRIIKAQGIMIKKLHPNEIDEYNELMDLVTEK